MDIRIEQARHRRYARIDLFVDGQNHQRPAIGHLYAGVDQVFGHRRVCAQPGHVEVIVAQAQRLDALGIDVDDDPAHPVVAEAARQQAAGVAEAANDEEGLLDGAHRTRELMLVERQ